MSYSGFEGKRDSRQPAQANHGPTLMALGQADLGQGPHWLGPTLKGQEM